MTEVHVEWKVTIESQIQFNPGLHLLYVWGQPHLVCPQSFASGFQWFAVTVKIQRMLEESGL